MKKLGGQTLSAEDIRRVVASTGVALSPEVTALLASFPLVGLTLSIAADANESGLSVELRWMTADEIIDEATNVYPGIVAVQHGYLPVGLCLEGRGDPYFLRLADGAIVRIPHDSVDEADLDADAIELVAPSIAELVDMAEITGPAGN
jgi:hypothetical protein